MAKTILILAANPKDTTRLRLDQEVREIDNGLRRAKRRDEFVLEHKWAVRPKDVRRAVLDTRPNIVHFCGHGKGEEGIVLEDETGHATLIGAEALAGFFKLFAGSVECVVLNACYSESQAEAIAQHIEYVIGMKRAIGDDAAIEFSVAFYDALGAGESIEFAHGLACNAILWAGTPGHLTPVLKHKARSAPAQTSTPAVRSVPATPKKVSLPAWFWPVVAGVAALLIALVIAFSVLLYGGDDKGTVIPQWTKTAVAVVTMPLALPTPSSTQSPMPEETDTPRPSPTHTDTPQPTDTRPPTLTPTPKPTKTPLPPTRTPTPTAVDVAPPNIELSLSPSSPKGNEWVTFQALASDDQSGVDSIEIEVDGVLQQTCSVSPCKYTGGPYTIGMHTSQATAWDKKGNSLSTPQREFSVSPSGPGVASIHGTLLYRKEPVTKYSQRLAECHIAKDYYMYSYECGYDTESGAYAVYDLPAGNYQLQLGVDVDGNGWPLANDFFGFSGNVTTTGGQASVSLNIDLVSIMHLTAPFDNLGFTTVPPAYPDHDRGTLEFQWDAVTGAASYHVEITEFHDEPDVAWLRSMVWTDTDVTSFSTDLPASPADHHYRFYVTALDGAGQEVTWLMVSSADGHQTHYAFKVR